MNIKFPQLYAIYSNINKTKTIFVFDSILIVLHIWQELFR